MEFRLLGPLEVVDDGHRLPLGGAKQRSLLAVLLLNANEVVSTDRLIDELWGEAPPATADKSVQVYVSRLRKALGNGRLVTRAPGYVLQVDAAELDLARFEQLVAEAERAGPDAAAKRLRAALGVWRGPPLADLAYEQFAQPAIARLEEMRWAAQEKRIDADLAAGRHAELVGELEGLVARHPLRERLRCQLMLALYRSGRQAEALDVYRSARHDLAEQLGLEPGDELKRLERAILQQDPSLDLERKAKPRTARRAEPEAAAIAGMELPTRLVSRRRSLVAAGIALVTIAAAGAAAALLSSGDGDGSGLGTVGNGVAAIAPDGSRVAELVESSSVPGNIAVGEGAVWVLDSEQQTVSRIDPETKAVTGRFETRGVPTDIAAGAGAVWVGTGGGAHGNTTVSISRVDPQTLRPTQTLKLPDETGDAYTGALSWGFPNIAVTDDAVWAENPDGTLSRIDPESGKLVTTLEVSGPLAAADNGVWFPGEGEVSRIDPRTNKVAETIPIGATETAGIAFGAGAVWVAAEQQGVVWRVDPGPDPETRSIEVGAGVTYVAFGEGALWAANYIDGTVARIDPSTNTVTARTQIGAAQALAAGEGSAWVSTAGGTEAGTLPASACEELFAGGAEPDVVIVSDLPLQGPDGAGPRAMADAIRQVVRDHGFRAGDHSVGYRSCDESTAQAGAFDLRRCAANANAYANADRLVAVIGPWSSYCAQIMLPTLSRAEGGPPAVISPTNTHAGLTRDTAEEPPEALPGEPDVYYPSGIRNYVRLQPGDDMQAAALAVHAKDLGLASVYVLDDGSSFWKGLLSDPFRRAAAHIDLRVAGSSSYDQDADRHHAVADRVARSGAEGVVLAGDPFDGGGDVLKALRARLGARFAVLGSFFFAFVPEVRAVAGRAANGIYATTLDLPRSELSSAPTRAAQEFARVAGIGSTPEYGVMEAGQAAELVMSAIARSDGTRGSVIEELKASEVQDGILGSFRFDENGDITPAPIPVLRIVGARAGRRGLSGLFEGAVVDRVVRVPPELVE